MLHCTAALFKISKVHDFKIKINLSFKNGLQELKMEPQRDHPRKREHGLPLHIDRTSG